ncbi:hypothetical protein VNO77_23306 [Canavalia gladiata]|uniref:Uncharacterized protein n=1 Tax=Canavalia gladiata TaxID=3824 RepID=A0AAN9L4A7_CANGL
MFVVIPTITNKPAWWQKGASAVASDAGASAAASDAGASTAGQKGDVGSSHAASYAAVQGGDVGSSHAAAQGGEGSASDAEAGFVDATAIVQDEIAYPQPLECVVFTNPFFTLETLVLMFSSPLNSLLEFSCFPFHSKCLTITATIMYSKFSARIFTLLLILNLSLLLIPIYPFRLCLFDRSWFWFILPSFPYIVGIGDIDQSPFLCSSLVPSMLIALLGFTP